jgi:molybdopterin synthase sulfur carrier subunit
MELHVETAHRSSAAIAGYRAERREVAVEVRLPAVLRRFTGGEAVVTGHGQTLKELIVNLDAKFPGIADQLIADDDLHRFVNIYVNDEDVRYLGKLAAPLADDDVVSILPAVAGG